MTTYLLCSYPKIRSVYYLIVSVVLGGTGWSLGVKYDVATEALRVRTYAQVHSLA